MSVLSLYQFYASLLDKIIDSFFKKSTFLNH